MEFLREECIEQDRQTQYRHREKGAVPAPEDVCIRIIQDQQTCQ
jgi:hypothetical protein